MRLFRKRTAEERREEVRQWGRLALYSAAAMLLGLGLVFASEWAVFERFKPVATYAGGFGLILVILGGLGVLQSLFTLFVEGVIGIERFTVAFVVFMVIGGIVTLFEGAAR